MLKKAVFCGLALLLLTETSRAGVGAELFDEETAPADVLKKKSRKNSV